MNYPAIPTPAPPAQCAHDHADVLHRGYVYNVGQFGPTPRVKGLRSGALGARQKANAIGPASVARSGDLNAATWLQIETLAVEESVRELFGDEIYCLQIEIAETQAQLRRGGLSAKAAFNLSERLIEARLDLMQAQCEGEF